MDLLRLTRLLSFPSLGSVMGEDEAEEPWTEDTLGSRPRIPSSFIPLHALKIGQTEQSNKKPINNRDSK